MISTLSLSSPGLLLQERVGDILYDTDDISIDHKMKAGLVFSRKWDRGVLPIIFDSRVTPREKYNFLEACKEWESIANIRCIAGDPSLKHILVKIEPKGCFSAIGQGPSYSKVRVLNLERIGCWSKRTIVHEIGHALGFFHEHQRKDRNKYLTILTTNIRPSAIANFFNLFWISSNEFYDYESIMHYKKNSFSKNKLKNTMQPKKPYEDFLNIIGNKDSLSYGDKQQAINYYGKRVE
jgi:hypothetical protein